MRWRSGHRIQSRSAHRANWLTEALLSSVVFLADCFLLRVVPPDLSRGIVNIVQRSFAATSRVGRLFASVGYDAALTARMARGGNN